MQQPSSASGIATLEPPGPRQPASLLTRLDATRRGLRRARQARSLLWLAVVVLLWCGLLGLADWLWVLDAGPRAAALLALVPLVLGWLSVGVFAARIDERRTADEVEGHFPELGQSVQTTLEYVRPAPDTAPARPGLVAALAQSTERRTRALPLEKLVPWRSLLWPAAVLAGLVTAFGVLLASNEELRTTARRLLLMDAHYTRLEVSPGDYSLKVGGDFTVRATVSGRPVSEVELYSRPILEQGRGVWVSVVLAAEAPPAKVSGELETTLPDCRDDLEYYVVAGPVHSPVYRLHILRPLVLHKVEAAVEPPAYTRRPPAVFTEGNFKVLEGSRVRLKFTLDREPASAHLLVSPTDSKEPAVPQPLTFNGPELTAELPRVEKELAYEVRAEAADGMRLEPVRFRIEVQPDKKPTVRLLQPTETVEAVPTGEVVMRVRAEDDIGLSKVGIVYRVGDGEPKTLYLRDLAGESAGHTAEAVLALEDHSLNFQDGLSYYAFAEDNRPDGPQRGTTELQFIDVRPFKRSFQMLKTGGS